MTIASIILCAGNSTRMNSKKNKLLHELCGKPLSFWVIDLAMAAHSEKIFTVLNPNSKDLSAAIFGRYQSRVSFATQKDQLGTGDAVKSALPLIDDSSSTVLILCGDTPLLKQSSLEKLCELREGSGCKIAMLSSQTEKPFGYGRIIRNEKNHIIKVVEEITINNTGENKEVEKNG